MVSFVIFLYLWGFLSRDRKSKAQQEQVRMRETTFSRRDVGSSRRWRLSTTDRIRSCPKITEAMRDKNTSETKSKLQCKSPQNRTYFCCILQFAFVLCYGGPNFISGACIFLFFRCFGTFFCWYILHIWLKDPFVNIFSNNLTVVTEFWLLNCACVLLILLFVPTVMVDFKQEFSNRFVNIIDMATDRANFTQYC